MENYEFKDISLEQRKAISKIVSLTRWNLVWIFVKFSLLLFISNLSAIVLGFILFKDSDPSFMTTFNFCVSFVNTIFLYVYLNRQLKNNSATMNVRISEILKK